MDVRVNAAGKLSLVGLEYNLAEHCNLSCYGCDHASPLLAKKFAALADFERDMRALAEVAHVGELRLVGGEPLLHPDLLQFIALGRAIGVADRILVCTNGVLLHTMPDEFWAGTDMLTVSIYPGVRRRMTDEAIAARCAEHGVALELRHMDEFGRSLINTPVEDEALVKGIFRDCKTAHEWGCLAVHDGMFFRCSVAPFTQKRLALAGIDFPGNEVDGVRLAGNNNLRENLAARLASEEPLAACRYCLGSSGPIVAHRQMNRRGCQDWIDEDNRADIAFARRSVRRETLRRRLPRLASAVRKARQVLNPA